MEITAAASAMTTTAVMILYRGKPEELGERPMYEELNEEKEEKEDGIAYKDIFRTSQFYLLAAGYILVPMAAQGALSNLPLLTSSLGYEQLSGTFLSVALIASALFFVPAGAIIDKMGTKWMVALATAFLGNGFLLLLFGGTSLGMTYGASALIGAASDACQLPFGISVREAFGSREYSKKLGVISAFVFSALAFGPSLMTMFFDMTGDYRLAMEVFLIMGIGGSVAIYMGTKRVK